MTPKHSGKKGRQHSEIVSIKVHNDCNDLETVDKRAVSNQYCHCKHPETVEKAPVNEDCRFVMI